MKARALPVLLATLLAGCGPMSLHYRSTDDINWSRGSVTLELHELSRPPEGLSTMTCEDLAVPEARTVEALGSKRMELESVLPGSEHHIEFTSPRGRSWLMIIPLWSQCTEDANAWALVRAWRGVHRVRVELDDNQLSFPWERRRRQRGWIGGQPHHVLLPAARPRDRR